MEVFDGAELLVEFVEGVTGRYGSHLLGSEAFGVIVDVYQSLGLLLDSLKEARNLVVSIEALFDLVAESVTIN